MDDKYTSNIRVIALDASIQKLASAFCCGNPHIDNFLRSGQALDVGFGKTFVWLTEGEKAEIIGYYNIAAGSINQIDGERVSKMGGAIHINEFAIHEKFRGKFIDERLKLKYSDILLGDCIQRIQHLRSQSIGVSFVTLHSTREGMNLYLRNDFCEIEEEMNLSKMDNEKECTPMYLALDLE